jgi:hypothetical protein
VSPASKYGKAPVAGAVPMFERRETQTPQFDNRKFRILASAVHAARTWANKVQNPVCVWDCRDFFALSTHHRFSEATRGKNLSHTWPHRIGV